ncbi:MAG: winged helix-turn-helix domain-containing protein, partial [Pseudomonadota bacterium]
ARSAARQAAAGSATELGRLALDLDLREARLDGALLDLSQTEFNVLMRLMRGAGRWVSVDEVAGAAFGAGCENPQAQVYEYIKRLRQKLGPGVIRNRRRRLRLRAAKPEGPAADGIVI